MEKNNIVRIIGTYLSAASLPKRKRRFRNGSLKIETLKKKEKASLEYWDQLEAKQTRTLNLH